MNYKQYDVILVNLDPTVGTEIAKTRPCVIISPNEMNFTNVIIAPLTSTYKDYPTRVKLKDDSYVVLDQIRTISSQRIVKKLEFKISKSKIESIKNTIKIMLID